MIFKKGDYWKACFNEESDNYAAEYGGGQDYHIYEINKELFDLLDEKMPESEASRIISQGRHLYMNVNDRCGPPYTVVFDEDYKTIAPFASVISSGKVWSDELTDVVVKLFESEKNNPKQRKAKKQNREKEK